jgi:hypothetical protein
MSSLLESILSPSCFESAASSLETGAVVVAAGCCLWVGVDIQEMVREGAGKWVGSYK